MFFSSIDFSLINVNVGKVTAMQNLGVLFLMSSQFVMTYFHILLSLIETWNHSEIILYFFLQTDLIRVSQLHTILPNPFIQTSKLDRFGDVSRLIMVLEQEFVELKEIKDWLYIKGAVYWLPFFYALLFNFLPYFKNTFVYAY